MDQVEIVEVTNTDDSNEKFYVKIENILTHDVLPSVAPAAHVASRQYRYIFRKMSTEEFEKLVEDKNLILKFKKRRKMHTAEKWVTETIDHSAQYENKGCKGETKVAEIKVQEAAYDKIREEAIPQFNSKEKQPMRGQGKPYNITNTELIKDQPGKVNLGIKGQENLDKFNKHIVAIREVKADTFRNENAIVTWMKRNKLAATVTAIGIIIDANNIRYSIISDGGKFGKETQITFGEILGGIAGAELAVVIGAKIGAALGTVVPGIGNFIAGFIGGIIGSFAGGKLVRHFHLMFEDPVSEEDNDNKETVASPKE